MKSKLANIEGTILSEILNQERKSLPITLEVENDNSMGEGREIQGREIPTVCNESETNNGTIRI